MASALALPITAEAAPPHTGVGAKPIAGAEVLLDGSRAMLDEKWTYWEGPRFATALAHQVEDRRGPGRWRDLSDDRRPRREGRNNPLSPALRIAWTAVNPFECLADRMDPKNKKPTSSEVGFDTFVWRSRES